MIDDGTRLIQSFTVIPKENHIWIARHLKNITMKFEDLIRSCSFPNATNVTCVIWTNIPVSQNSSSCIQSFMITGFEFGRVRGCASLLFFLLAGLMAKWALVSTLTRFDSISSISRQQHIRFSYQTECGLEFRTNFLQIFRIALWNVVRHGHIFAPDAGEKSDFWTSS